MDVADAEYVARTLMDEHGLQNWRFGFDRAVRRFGCCHLVARKITLSKLLVELNDFEKVWDTVLHEIAHALAPRDEHHGREWKAIAARIGAEPTRCYDDAVVVEPAGRWVGVCPECRKCTTPRHRRRNVSCGRCSQGTYDAAYKLTWVESENVRYVFQWL